VVLRSQTMRRSSHSRTWKAVVAVSLALAWLAMLPAPGLATNNIAVALGGTAVEVNGTKISTTNLTLGQLAKLQGVPEATVKLEFDGVAAGTPVASAVESLVEGLPLETSLASALDQVSSASGGLVSPAQILQRVVEDNGQPGASGPGSAGPAGANGAPGAAGASSSAAAGATKKKAFTLRLSSRSVKGHPRSRVRITFTVSSAAKITYSGHGLAKGSRRVGSGRTTLVVVLPAKHGNYQLALKAVSTTEGQTAQATALLHDAERKPSRGRRR
jgi:hypothetical protein